jgi:hypothetical protein
MPKSRLLKTLKAINNIAPLIVIFLALGWTLNSLLTQAQFLNSTQVEKLQSLWNQDVIDLENAKALPDGWYRIKSIEFYSGDSGAQKWIDQKLHPPQKTLPNGSHRLEILLLSFEDKGKIGAIVQYNLVDIKTQNMEWELGRTFYLNSNKNEWIEWFEEKKESIQNHFAHYLPITQNPPNQNSSLSHPSVPKVPNTPLSKNSAPIKKEKASDK